MKLKEELVDGETTEASKFAEKRTSKFTRQASFNDKSLDIDELVQELENRENRRLRSENERLTDLVTRIEQKKRAIQTSLLDAYCVLEEVKEENESQNAFKTSLLEEIRAENNRLRWNLRFWSFSIFMMILISIFIGHH